jgi:hypothetical protein
VAHLSVIALSINGGIKTLGSYAGLAAVVALALLALLYFAQARELKRLREWIEHEAQRPRGPAPARSGAPAPARKPVPAPAPAPLGPLATGVASTPATPMVATTVEGVRRVPLPAVAADGTVVMPAGPAAPSAPDATTINEPEGLEEAPAPEPAAQEPRLVAERVAGQEPGSAHDVGEGLVIGRAKGVSIRLTDPLVSGRHARVAVDGEDVALEDLGSTNGTFLNGAQLSAPAILSNGDRVRVGESEFVFESVPAAPPPVPNEATPEVGVVPTPDAGAENAPPDDAGEVAGSSAAIPLLATPVPERTIELEDEGAAEAVIAPQPRLPPPPRPPAPQPAPPAGTGAVRLPPAPITRMARGGGGDDERADESATRVPRLLGADALAGRRVVLGGIVLALAAIIVVVVLLGSGGGTKATGSAGTTGTSNSTAGSATSKTAHAAPPRASITIAVLNGTTTAGLAGQLSAKLVGDGFVKGDVADAPSQTATTTTIGYTAGNKAAALEVAKLLAVSASHVMPVTSANEAAASAAGGRPQVVVTIGVQHPQ